jgi:hypothetical protein
MRSARTLLLLYRATWGFLESSSHRLAAAGRFPAELFARFEPARYIRPSSAFIDLTGVRE